MNSSLSSRPAGPVCRACLAGFLALLTISAVWSRAADFRKPSLRTIDEILYYRMARQVKADPLDYSPRACATYLKAKGRTLPEYFHRPLFKHPPLFIFLIAGVLKLFGDKPFYAGYVSILAGSLLIPLGYLIAARLYGRTAGLVTATALFLDPIAVMSSQKLWMDTTMAFSMTFAVYAFLRAIDGDPRWFATAGLAGGAATLVKYPGALVIIAFVAFAVIFRRDLLRRSAFLNGVLLIPFLLFLPWAAWNLAVYGPKALEVQEHLHGLDVRPARTALLGLGSIVVLALLALVKSRFLDERRPTGRNAWGPATASLLFIVLILGVAWPGIAANLDWTHTPQSSWVPGLFKETSGPRFYFVKLSEYSLLYGFAFLAFALRLSPRRQSEDFLKLYTALILFFFTWWGNVQSRYILPAVPGLLVLGGGLINGALGWARGLPKAWLRLGALTALCALLTLIAVRTYDIDVRLSFTNDYCYF